MTEKFITVAEIEVPDDPYHPAEIIEYKSPKLSKEFIPGTIERVVHIHYSEEIHGRIDAIFANGVRFVPEVA